MLNKKTKYTLAGLAILAAAFGAGYFSKPAKVVTEIKEKQVIVYKEKKEERRNVTTTRRRTTRPDGSSTEEETTTDTSVTDTSSEASSSRETSSRTSTTRTSGLQISALMLAKDLNVNEYEFGISVSKRVLGNISVGVIATEKRQFGLMLGLEF